MLLKVQYVNAVGQAWNRTECAFCKTPYVYMNVQRGYGERLGVPLVGAKALLEGASADAQQVLARNLATRESLARCPSCGKFQLPMIYAARQDREVRAKLLGKTLAVLAMFGFAIAAAIWPKNNNWLILSMVPALLVGLILTHFWVLAIRRWFDPNKGVFMLMPPNKKIAARGMTLEEFEQRLAEDSARSQRA